MFCFEGESHAREITKPLGKKGDTSMIWEKMSCINGWMVISNLVISLVPQYKKHKRIEKGENIIDQKESKTE